MHPIISCITAYLYGRRGHKKGADTLLMRSPRQPRNGNLSTSIEDNAYTIWWRHQLSFDVNKASSISENTNHHFGRSYFLTSFRGFSGERKIIVNAYYVYTMLYKNVYSLVFYSSFLVNTASQDALFCATTTIIWLVVPTCYLLPAALSRNTSDGCLMGIPWWCGDTFSLALLN